MVQISIGGFSKERFCRMVDILDIRVLRNQITQSAVCVTEAYPLVIYPDRPEKIDLAK